MTSIDWPGVIFGVLCWIGAIWGGILVLLAAAVVLAACRHRMRGRFGRRPRDGKRLSRAEKRVLRSIRRGRKRTADEPSCDGAA